MPARTAPTASQPAPRPQYAAAQLQVFFQPLAEGLMPLGVEAMIAHGFSVQATGVFFLGSRPPNLRPFDGIGRLLRESSGFGPFAGGRLMVGYWLPKQQRPRIAFRAGYGTESFLYRWTGPSGQLDAAKYTRHYFVASGAIYWFLGPISAGIEGGAKLDFASPRRCFVDVAARRATTDPAECPAGRFEILTSHEATLDGFNTTVTPEATNIRSSSLQLPVFIDWVVGVAF